MAQIRRRANATILSGERGLANVRQGNPHGALAFPPRRLCAVLCDRNAFLRSRQCLPRSAACGAARLHALLGDVRGCQMAAARIRKDHDLRPQRAAFRPTPRARSRYLHRHLGLRRGLAYLLGRSVGRVLASERARRNADGELAISRSLNSSATYHFKLTGPAFSLSEISDATFTLTKTPTGSAARVDEKPARYLGAARRRAGGHWQILGRFRRLRSRSCRL